MDPDIVSKGLAAALGASPFALLAVWVIRWAFQKITDKDKEMADALGKKDERIVELTDALLTLAKSNQRTTETVLGVGKNQ